MVDHEGKSRGFGFVAFETPEEAEQAVNATNDMQLEGSEKKLVVCRAQKKIERQAELKRKFDAQKAERLQRYQGVNLYVKNLDDSVDDEQLRKSFEPFGKITSAKVMTDENGRTKGFGFVCFEKPDEATKAVTDMNTKMMNSKPLYVAIAQRKEDRRAQLASMYMQRLANIRMHGNVPGTMYTPGTGGYFVSNAAPSQRGAFMTGAAIPGGMRGPQRWNAPASQYGVPAGPYMVQTQGFQGRRAAGAAPTGRPTQYGQVAQGVAPRGAAQPRMQQGVPTGAPRPQVGVKPGQQMMYGQQGVYAQGQQQRSGTQQGIVVGGQEPLTSHMLAQAAPQEQKQMLGERIYTLIDKMYGATNDAGKITGMMLEMENSELIMLLQDDELFRSKVQEAANVLKSAAQTQTKAT